MKIGVLDIQGSVVEHAKALRLCGVDPVFVKKSEDLEGLSGLIIPGGESTTIGKLLCRFGLDEAIKDFVKQGGAVWGTCAGAILLANRITGPQQAQNLELIDLEIERNAYGRQLDSFETRLEFDYNGEIRIVDAVFIRAPRLKSCGPDIKVLATYKNEPVAVRQGKIMVTTFHPELTEDTAVHQYFIELSSGNL